MDDRVLALCELSNDLLYHKIPSDKLAYYIDNSLISGKTIAGEFQPCDIKQLYIENNIQINYHEKSNEKFGVTFRGQSVMSKKGCSVELYRSSVQELANHSTYKKEKILSYDIALQVHLAHEFFHIIEYKRGYFVSEQLEPIQTIKLPFISKMAHISRCSEIAAHAFAEKILDLPVLPNYYDYLYLIDTGKMSQKTFDNMIEHNIKLLSQNKD